MNKYISAAALLFIFSNQVGAACPAPRDVAGSLKFMTHLNPGMMMNPTPSLGQYVVGTVKRGSHLRTATQAPKKLSVIDRGNVCNYREGTIMKGITMEFELVRLDHFHKYWDHEHDYTAVYYGNNDKAKEVLKSSLEKSKQLSMREDV